MEPNNRNKLLGGLLGVAVKLNPLTSVSFLLALAVVALGTWVWFRHSGESGHGFPVYGAVGASYAGGFLIGRVFRRVLKIAAIVAAIVLGGLGLLNRAHLDTSKAEQAVRAGSTWVEDKAGRAKDYLMHLLPSGTAGGVGVFAGGRRRRNKDDADEHKG